MKEMEDKEVRDWLDHLSRTPQGQRAYIYNLLTHEKEDELSPEDKKVCLRALLLLKEDVKVSVSLGHDLG